MEAGRFPSLLQDEQAHPIALLREMVKRYGVEWMEWMPSVVRQTLSQTFGVAPARVSIHKLLGAAAVATRDEFWESWPVFHFLCQALNNNIPDSLTHQELTVGQMMVAVDMATQIRTELGKISNVPEFSEEVARYIAAQALARGVWYLPTPLEFAAPFAAGRRYRCRSCGNDGEVLFDDGVCDVCTERFDTESLGDWRPKPELLAKWGRNLEFYEKNPTDKVKARLEQVLKNPSIVLGENQTDVCVARLIVALQYVAHRRGQLAGQA